MVDHEENIEKEDENLIKPKTGIEKTNKWKANKKTLTNNEIISNAILFFIAGYDTTATTLSFISYNLAMNPECQEKLCFEIDQILENHVNINL